MDFSVCSQCGTEIVAKGIQFRGKSFCGDVCCEVFEKTLVDDDEPIIDELEDEEFDELEEDGLGYEVDPTEEKKRNPLDSDDEFEIDPDDF